MEYLILYLLVGVLVSLRSFRSSSDGFSSDGFNKVLDNGGYDEKDKGNIYKIMIIMYVVFVFFWLPSSIWSFIKKKETT